MRATLSWAAPAMLLACMGCGHEGASTKKAPSPGSTSAKTDDAVTGSMTTVTLKVDGMT
ncbi:MAG: hypothetical protein L0Y71_23945 [Gemmataceae bacterium]|nr:hypothetical protein [Gemmataceae bacterium]